MPHRLKLHRLPLAGLLAFCQWACPAAAPELIPLAPLLPKPTFEGTPVDVRSPHREAYRGEGVPPPPLLVPAGTRLLSAGCPVSASDPRAPARDLALVTDGNKRYSPSAYLELAPGVQWVQLDLRTNAALQAVCLWRERPEQCVYRDTVVQVSDTGNTLLSDSSSNEPSPDPSEAKTGPAGKRTQHTKGTGAEEG